jgi:glutamine cyclotransferase
MKFFFYHLFLITLFFLAYSCSDQNDQTQEKSIDFGFTLMRTNYMVQKGELFSFNCEGVSSMDRMELYINGENHQSWNQPESEFFQVKTDGLELGIYSIEIRGFKNNELISADGRVLMVNSPESLKEIDYQVVSSHPHNPTNFTQGYEFHLDRLYESTGNPNNRGTTKVAEINSKTGASTREVIQPNPIFGEGISVLGTKVYQISWRDQKCFVYDINTFELDTIYIYSGEGWGLCNDETSLIMSNGTHELVYRDPLSFQITKRISVHSDKGPITNLNELEFHDGRVYANLWRNELRNQEDSRMSFSKIVEINPQNGQVTGYIDIRDLIERSIKSGVPNGIAFRASTNTFWMTGKNWNEAYEIKVNR